MNEIDKKMSIKNRIFTIIDDNGDGRIPNLIFKYFIIILILLNLITIFIETYRSIYAEYRDILNAFELFSVIVFTIEYLLRIWTCTEYPEYSNPVMGRLKYACSFTMVIDLLAFFPYYLALILPLDPKVVKFFRMLRLFRIFKLLRYYGSTDVIYEVIKKNRDYLIATVTILVLFLIFSSYIMFIVESDEQPEQFADIDNSFWWAVVSLTTVGYGDVYPVTDLGKTLTVIVLIIGIGIIALPTGIIASGFLEEMRFRKENVFCSQNASPTDEIRKAHELMEEGIITKDEFIRIKEKILK